MSTAQIGKTVTSARNESRAHHRETDQEIYPASLEQIYWGEAAMTNQLVRKIKELFHLGIVETPHIQGWKMRQVRNHSGRSDSDRGMGLMRKRFTENGADLKPFVVVTHDEVLHGKRRARRLRYARRAIVPDATRDYD